jgi:ubiquinone/menaquinone biosynthesis C-methylase UbiE
MIMQTDKIDKNYVGHNKYVIDQDATEINRLISQGELISSHMPLLPLIEKPKEPGITQYAFIPSETTPILDVCCGAGDLIRYIHNRFPRARLIGIDNSKRAIEFAQNHRQTVSAPNVTYELASIYSDDGKQVHLPYPDNHFTMVNARLLLGVLNREDWIPFIQECYRILAPGGYIRLIEVENSITSDAPHLFTLMQAISLALWKAGKTFSANAYALTPILPDLLRRQQFEDVWSYTATFEWSYGQDLYESVTSDLVTAWEELKPLILKFGNMTADRYEQTYAGMLDEIRDPQFCAVWGAVAWQGVKL